MSATSSTSFHMGVASTALLLLVSGIVDSDPTATRGLSFNLDPTFNDRLVTSDTGSLDLVASTLSRCAIACSRHEFCTSFFYTHAGGSCSLHGTVFVSVGGASVSSGTRYYKNVVDQCQPDGQLLYNRFADMCVFFEVEAANFAAGWSPADSACVSMGMRLAHHLTPVKLDALHNFTIKNPGSPVARSVFIGMRRETAGQAGFVWLDGSALDSAALAPYWEAGQPNGAATGQDCVVVRGSVDATINDVSCSHGAFVCEKAMS